MEFIWDLNFGFWNLTNRFLILSVLTSDSDFRPLTSESLRASVVNTKVYNPVNPVHLVLK